MARYEIPALPREEDVKEGEILAGKYRVNRPMGAGGMGVVVEVTHLESAHKFALKFLRPIVARDPSAAARFLREAKAGRRISSPHVVTISDVGELASGSPFLVMEYLEGTSLDNRLVPLARSSTIRSSATVPRFWPVRPLEGRRRLLIEPDHVLVNAAA